MKWILTAAVLILFQVATPAQANSSALIYKGPGACDGCPESVGDVLKKMGVVVHYIKPGQLTLDRLRKADLYVQPGGTDYVEDTMKALSTSEVDALRTYVSEGGRYLGICAGGFLAGEWAEDPGKNVRTFGLIPGTVFEESKDRKARAEPIQWRGKNYSLYFQDGPKFDASNVPGGEVWATYLKTGHVAAMMAPFGKGRVGLIGPHPEADMDWFNDDHIAAPDGTHQKLAIQFVRALLK